MPATERLYYAPTAPRSFDAVIVRVEPRPEATAVWLDRTAFYPTSGGQPHDRGTLAGLPVVEVGEDADGDVVHLVSPGGPAAASLAPGARVHGDIDWARRVDHMQQHTGQHVLSAAIERRFQARTVSVHLGVEASTIDLDRELTAKQLLDAELEANRVVWDDRAVSVRYATAEEARALPLRKESARAGTLRLIEIDGVDLSACGGTHVARTGAIGQIALGGVERFKGGQRIEFVCGGRALRRHQDLRDASSAAVRLLSVLPSELPAAIERLQSSVKEQKRALAAAQLEAAHHQAASLVASAAPRQQGPKLVFEVVDGDAARLKALASALAAHPGVFALLVSRAVPALAVAARGDGVDRSCVDLMAALTTRFGGRGGGKADLAQGGGLDAAPDAILEYARAAAGC